MVVIAAEKIDVMEESVKSLSYHLGDNLDNWYPSKSDIDKLLPLEEEDVAFLIWCMYPRFNLSDEQKEVKKYVQSILATEIKFDEKPLKELDKKEEASILKKYGF